MSAALDREAFISAMRLGAWCMRRLAEAKCGNHSEGALEEAMTNACLRPHMRKELNAEANAADEIRKTIGDATAYEAFGYASYMGGEPIEAAMAALGIDSTWMRKPDPEVRDRFNRTEVPDLALSKASPPPSPDTEGGRT